MAKILSAVCLFLLTAPAWAQSVKLPQEVRGDPGVILVVRADTDCPTLRWLVIDPGLSLIPPDLLKDSRVAVVMGGRPGRYRLLAYGAKGDSASEPAVCTVILGDVPPGPTPPGPNPPGPGPLPPTPTPPDAALVKTLQAAYTAEPGNKKPGQRAFLAALYGSATEKEVRDPALTTVGALLAKLGAIRKQEVGDTEMVGVRNAIAVWLGQQIPGDVAAVALDPATRDKVASLFKTVAASLGEVK